MERQNSMITLTRLDKRVIILNAEPTEMDNLADALLRGSISDVLPRLVALDR